ncbi:MAG: hypothetical protein ABI765_14405 [Gemmatimonadota bacterium]
MKYDPNDYSLNEPHYAARWVTTGQTVRIMYLLSYYRDWGSNYWLCTYNPEIPFIIPTCDEHLGDSEWIVEDIVYDAETQHSLLSRAEYSQHEGSRVFVPGAGHSYPPLQYPEKSGGYPEAWVAIGKHASYASAADCSAATTDYCSDSPQSMRVNAGPNVNIGSRAHHLISQDCSTATNPLHPYFVSGKTECYWSGAHFTGWFPDNAPGIHGTDPYDPKLASEGF